MNQEYNNPNYDRYNKYNINQRYSNEQYGREQYNPVLSKEIKNKNKSKFNLNNFSKDHNYHINRRIDPRIINYQKPVNYFSGDSNYNSYENQEQLQRYNNYDSFNNYPNTDIEQDQENYKKSSINSDFNQNLDSKASEKTEIIPNYNQFNTRNSRSPIEKFDYSEHFKNDILGKNNKLHGNEEDFELFKFKNIKDLPSKNIEKNINEKGKASLKKISLKNQNQFKF